MKKLVVLLIIVKINAYGESFTTAGSNIIRRAAYKSGSEGNEGVVKISLSDSGNIDGIWFYPWPGASNGNDPDLDVTRLGNNATHAVIDFSENNTPMKLWVNAITDNLLSVQLPLYVTTPRTGNFTIALSNLEGLATQYDCVRLYDKGLQRTVDLDEKDSYTFSSPAGYRGERFVLQLTKTLTGNIYVENSTCHENNDGRLEVDLSGFGGTKDFQLYKGSEEIGRYAGDLHAISESLGQGEYRLVNNNGSISCGSSEYHFVISSLPKVISDFHAPSMIYTNTPVTFTNFSSGADHYVWTFKDDQSTSAEQHAQHTFKAPGIYEVLLYADNGHNCEGNTHAKEVAVMSDTGISLNNDLGNIIVNTGESGLEIINTNHEGRSLYLYSTDGKLIRQLNAMRETEFIGLEKLSRVYIIVIATDSGTYRKTILY